MSLCETILEVAERSKAKIFAVLACWFDRPKELSITITQTISGPYSYRSAINFPLNCLSRVVVLVLGFTILVDFHWKFLPTPKVFHISQKSPRTCYSYLIHFWQGISIAPPSFVDFRPKCWCFVGIVQGFRICQKSLIFDPLLQAWRSFLSTNWVPSNTFEFRALFWLFLPRKYLGVDSVDLKYSPISPFGRKKYSSVHECFPCHSTSFLWLRGGRPFTVNFGGSWHFMLLRLFILLDSQNQTRCSKKVKAKVRSTNCECWRPCHPGSRHHIGESSTIC